MAKQKLQFPETHLNYLRIYTIALYATPQLYIALIFRLIEYNCWKYPGNRPALAPFRSSGSLATIADRAALILCSTRL